jgi:uncharacterized phage protein (TIGR02220 family)
MIDPRIWDSQQVMALTDSQFKLYIYLISQADDDGRVKVSLPLFRARVHPCDNFSEKMVDTDLEQIARAGLVVAYRDENYSYLMHPNWFRYQRIDRPSPSVLPSFDDESIEVLYELSPMTRRLIAERSSNPKKQIKSITNDSTNDRRKLDESSTSPRDTLIYTNLSSPLSSPELKEREDNSEDVGEEGVEPSSPASSGLDRGWMKEVVGRLNEKAGTAFKADTDQTVRFLKARAAEGFVVEDFLLVIDFKVGQWRSDPEMAQYLRPSTLFSPKFEGYLQAARNAVVEEEHAQQKREEQRRPTGNQATPRSW